MGTLTSKWGTVLILLLFSIPAFSASWESKAKKEFENDEYSEVIEIAVDHKKDKKNKIGLMLLAFSHLQLHEFNDTKVDKKKFNNYYDLLEDTVSAQHLNEIHYFVEQTDKPEVVKQSRSLLKKAFKSIKDITDAPRLLPFINSDDEKTRKLAIATLEDIISVKRKYVVKGGTLRNKDIVVLQDKKVIRALLENINDSNAFSALIDIEQPVLSHIDNFEGKKAIKLEGKINKAIAKREKKYPESNWYSATGKTREKAIKL